MAKLRPVSASHARLAAGIFVSGLVHGASTWMDPVAPASVSAARPVEFELALEPAADDLPVPSEPPPAPRESRPARRASRRAAEPERVAPDVQPVPTLSPEPTPAPSAPAQSKGVDLSPLAAARTLVDVRAAPSFARSDLAASDVQDTPSTSSLAEGIPGVSPMAHQSFDAHAHRVQNSLLRPWSQRLPSGAYYYDGTGFDAVIRKDGSIAYRAKDGVHLSVMQTKKRTGEPGSAAVGLNLPDPERWLSRLFGSPQNQLEQRRFLESTRALREQLIEQSNQADRARAERAMERELSRIWSEGTTAALATRQRETFRLWDECAEDEVGAIMRKRITAFVRERCPENAACAFTPVVLAMLNAARRSRVVFAPYDSR